MIAQDTIKELWDSGFTLTRRLQDPTQIPAADIPMGRAYQWMHLVHDKLHIDTGWAPVPYDRHPGRFAPWGTEGNIEWNGLGLFEKPKFEIDAEHAANHAKAHQNVEDWKDRVGAEFSGHVKVGTSRDDAKVVDVGNKTVENVTAIPADMVMHMREIFAERDRIGQVFAANPEDPEVAEFGTAYTRRMAENPGALKWPTLNAIILPVAIKNIRNKLNVGETDGAPNPNAD